MKHCLDDKTILQIDLANDKKAMRFVVEGVEPIVAKADGDCCSHSWIEHVELPAGGFPAKVLSVSKLDLPGSTDNHPAHDYLQVYGLKIATDRGDIVIDYRNSSNGYYGGSLSWPGDDFYGGVYGQNVSGDEYQTLSCDV